MLLKAQKLLIKKKKRQNPNYWRIAVQTHHYWQFMYNRTMINWTCLSFLMSYLGEDKCTYKDYTQTITLEAK